jgi:hypothetical protein
MFKLKDKSGGSDSQLVKINIIDVADLLPRFIQPEQSDFPSIEFLMNKIDLQYTFFENQLSKLFDIQAISSNERPLGNITYELLPLQKSNEDNLKILHKHFKLKQNETTPQVWYLDCVESFHLEENEELRVLLIIRAYESPNLYADKRVLIKIENGDLCPPKFDKEIYEFSVVENMKEILDKIYVSDCDTGVNGRIHLSTTNPDFVLKFDEVYRQAKLGIEMKRQYDYEVYFKEHNGSSLIEFEIFAKSHKDSINKYETKALVKLTILDDNEFVPQFIKPAPIHGRTTREQQRIFFYNVPENEDFNLTVLAKDDDKTGLNDLDYNVRHVDEEEKFWVTTEYSNDSPREFKITVPGRFLSADSKVPIIFMVEVSDKGSAKPLKNEIIIFVRPQSNNLKPIYFEFEKYEFQLSETKPETFKVRLINENFVNRTNLVLKELHDPLNMFVPDMETQFITTDNRTESELVVIESEYEINLFLNQSMLDLDRVFIQNNRSNLYEYRLRAMLRDQPEVLHDVLVQVNLQDLNDNAPRIRNFVINNDSNVLEATIDEDYLENNLVINLNNEYLLLEFVDEDFSEKYGVQSLHFTLNDTRFFVENKYVEDDYVVPLIKVGNANAFDREKDPELWLKLTCEDNYFGRKLNKNETFFSYELLIHLRILESKSKQAQLQSSLFVNDTFTFSVKEGFTGIIGQLGKIFS